VYPLHGKKRKKHDDTAVSWGECTGPKNNGIPEHDVVRTWTAGDATGRIAREPLKITDKTSSAVGGLGRIDM
jgi:hypothetical protein